MKNSDIIDCTAENVQSIQTFSMKCELLQASELLTPSTLVNIGLFLVAALALLISHLTRRDSNRMASEALAESRRATDRQLKASHEALQADLTERQNSRELDITSEYISAVDALYHANQRKFDEPDRGEVLRATTLRVLDASSRYGMFVDTSFEINAFQVVFFKMLEGFEPKTMDDFGTKEFRRIHLVHAHFRTLIYEFQKERCVREMFIQSLAVAQACQETGDWKKLDEILEIYEPS